MMRSKGGDWVSVAKDKEAVISCSDLHSQKMPGAYYALKAMRHLIHPRLNSGVMVLAKVTSISINGQKRQPP